MATRHLEVEVQKLSYLRKERCGRRNLRTNRGHGESQRLAKMSLRN